jgi:phytoene dehydrogenase-like protein
MTDYDAIVVGAGHNGLVAGAQLARAGLKTLILERRSTIGGAAITEELSPGYRVSTLAHMAQPDASVIAALRLADHGLEMLDPDPFVFAPLPDGRSLVLGRDVSASTRSIQQFSEQDARRYGEFRSTMTRIGEFVSSVMAVAPPEIEQSTRGDLWTLLGMARGLQRLGKRDAYRLLRWAPMSAADFVSEWFESEPLRAVLAARGVFGNSLGPRSAGSAAILLMQLAAGGGVRRLVKGGLGAFTSALGSAARASGATIRTDAQISRIDVRNSRAAGVTLTSGEQLNAGIVLSNADPRRTLLTLIDPIELEPGFLARIRSYRSAGAVAKINLALRELPRFRALVSETDARELAGSIHIAPDLDYLERAFDASKYGTCSARPYLDITIPSLTDPSLAPPGAHVMSISAQFAPYRLRGTGWDTAGPRFADAVIETLEEHAPNVRSLILHRQLITPVDLESTYGLTGGHIFHGELALDQLFTMRPLLGWARYRTPIAGLYLCGAGTHPGYGISGLSGMNASREALKDVGRAH